MTFTRILSAILTLVSMIGLYCVFEKAGRDGWTALLPGYNLWATYDSFWDGKLFFLQAAVIVLGGGVLMLGMLGYFRAAVLSILCMVLGGLVFLSGLVMDFILSKKVSDAFGHGAGYAIGLTLFPWIFYPVLGFGKDSYIGN